MIETTGAVHYSTQRHAKWGVEVVCESNHVLRWCHDEKTTTCPKCLDWLAQEKLAKLLLREVEEEPLTLGDLVRQQMERKVVYKKAGSAG